MRINPDYWRDSARSAHSGPAPGGYMINLDLKEALSTLPLSEQRVKRAPQRPPRHAPSTKLTCGSAVLLRGLSR